MKTINIFGEGYFEKWNNTRVACRCVIVKENKILLSYEAVTDQWMLPGGGLENGESENECCVREVAEETGIIVKLSNCLLEINEYYEDWKWINKYFIGEVIGTTERKLTDLEKKVGMEPRWIPLEKIKSIFAKYNMYKGKDEMRRGMYLREYTALCELIKLLS